MIVRCYWNFHKKKYSIQQKNEKGNWLVTAHVTDFTLLTPQFVVHEAGRKRVLEEKKKNVHAYVIGQLIRNKRKIDQYEVDELSYNPYHNADFVVRATQKGLKQDYSFVHFKTKGEEPVMLGYYREV